MSTTRAARVEELLEGWLGRLGEGRLLMGKREAVAAELETWLGLLAAALSGDAASEHELYRLVALHAKALGAESRPASATIMQILVLGDSVEESEISDKPKALKMIREMTRVSADAHALGQSERLRDKHEDELCSKTPMVRLGPDRVLAFMIGPMTSRIIDSLFGRVLRECARVETHEVWVDLLGADPDDDRFHRTVAAFLESEPARATRLVLTGARDPEQTVRAIAALGTDLSRLRVLPKLDLSST